MTLDMAHWTYGAQIDHMSHDNRKGGFVHVKANSGHDSCHVTSGIAASSCCPKLRPTPPCHHFHQLSMLGVAPAIQGGNLSTIKAHKSSQLLISTTSSPTLVNLLSWVMRYIKYTHRCKHQMVLCRQMSPVSTP